MRHFILLQISVLFTLPSDRAPTVRAASDVPLQKYRIPFPSGWQKLGGCLPILFDSYDCQYIFTKIGVCSFQSSPKRDCITVASNHEASTIDI